MINGEFPPSACPVPVPITSNPVTDSSCGSSPCIRYSSPPVSLITCITWICLGNAQILCKNTSALFLGPHVCCLWILLVWVLLRLHLPLVIAISSCHCSRRKGEISQHSVLCNNVTRLVWQSALPCLEDLMGSVRSLTTIYTFPPPPLPYSLCMWTVSARHADSSRGWSVIPSTRSAQLPAAVQRVCRKHQQ